MNYVNCSRRGVKVRTHNQRKTGAHEFESNANRNDKGNTRSKITRTTRVALLHWFFAGIYCRLKMQSIMKLSPPCSSAGTLTRLARTRTVLSRILCTNTKSNISVCVKYVCVYECLNGKNMRAKGGRRRDHGRSQICSVK